MANTNTTDWNKNVTLNTREGEMKTTIIGNKTAEMIHDCDGIPVVISLRKMGDKWFVRDVCVRMPPITTQTLNIVSEAAQEALNDYV